MQLCDFKVLSFDCYGTIIDWETGILRALLPLAGQAEVAFGSDRMLEVFGRHEAAQQVETPSMPYSRLLGVVHGRIASEWGIAVTEEENARFGASIGDWPAFDDSAAALQYLKRHFTLVILSNVDRESFRRSEARLGVAFDHVYTAEDIGSYKPDLRNFAYLIARLGELGFAKGDVLHTAESLFHDHTPANRVGLASAWIHRRHGREGFGATCPPSEMPAYDFRFTGLGEMVEAHESELRGARRS